MDLWYGCRCDPLTPAKCPSVQVDLQDLLWLGATQPVETAVLACLWVAAKLEECRRGLPAASKVGLLVGVSCHVMGQTELHIMHLLDWRPLLGWVR